MAQGGSCRERPSWWRAHLVGRLRQVDLREVEFLRDELTFNGKALPEAGL